jgi:hypothetical protein
MVPGPELVFVENDTPNRRIRPLSAAMQVAQCKDSILAATGAQQLEHFPIPWHRKTSLDLCFIDFSSREPVSTSLENALEA